MDSRVMWDNIYNHAYFKRLPELQSAVDYFGASIYIAYYINMLVLPWIVHR